DCHPHPDLRQLRLQRPLSGYRRRDGIMGCGKDGVESISHRLERVTAMGLDRMAQESIVAGERGVHGGRMLLPELGAALDVREEEGDRSCSQWHGIASRWSSPLQLSLLDQGTDGGQIERG